MKTFEGDPDACDSMCWELPFGRWTVEAVTGTSTTCKDSQAKESEACCGAQDSPGLDKLLQQCKGGLRDSTITYKSLCQLPAAGI